MRVAPLGATLGHLLNYHRREAKPEWWAYFRAPQEVARRSARRHRGHRVSDAVRRAARDRRSNRWCTRSPSRHRSSSSRWTAASKVRSARAPPGTIEWIDASAGRLGLSRGPEPQDEPLPRRHHRRRAGSRQGAARGHRPRGRRGCSRALAAIGPSRTSCVAAAALLAARRAAIQTLDLEQQKQLVCRSSTTVTCSSRVRRAAARRGPARG